MQQERFVPTNNNLIPYQIINNNSKCDNSNGKLDMFKYGLSNTKKNNLLNSYNSMGILSNNATESPYYTPLKIDLNYAQFLKNTQKCKVIDNTTYPYNTN